MSGPNPPTVPSSTHNSCQLDELASKKYLLSPQNRGQCYDLSHVSAHMDDRI